MQQSLSLLACDVDDIDNVHQQTAALAGIRAYSHLWLCLYFHALPLEVLSGTADVVDKPPLAVCIEHQRQSRILACNWAAGELGVRPGLPVNAALALAPDLDIRSRDSGAELRVLQRLASAAIRFTPAVSIEPPDVLLLDIQASLKLFGGITRLRERVLTAFTEYEYRLTCAVAPTASAALWLARAGRGQVVRRRALLSGSLASLPLDCLCWPDKVRIALERMGVRTLGECVRLPRDGLARRIGPGRLAELDRGLGRRPEPRAFYVPPERFQDVLELPAESVDGELLLESLKILLVRLKSFLLQRQVAIQTLWIRLYHHDQPATLIRVGLLRPAMDTAYLLELARIHFNDAQFCAPVVAICVQTDAVVPCTNADRDLFGASSGAAGKSIELLERLRMRLGAQSVFGLRTVPEHRPESAWASVTDLHRYPECRESFQPAAERPVWMLAEPLKLQVAEGRPVYRDVLDLDRDPERIETGWWDGRDIRRDYYIARNGHGARLWIFRDHRESAWYLHGLFG